MNRFALLVPFLFTFSSFAQDIHEVVAGKYDPELRIIKYVDGTVSFVKNGEKIDAHPGPALMEYEVPLLKGNSDTRPKSRDLSTSYVTARSIYQPTVLLNYSVAQDVMNEMNRNYADGSQCYDRAHVWTYEENQKYGTNLMKAFLFFSDDYIERYQFPWWFHVAPFSYLKMNGALTERILDPAFAKYPLKFKLWTDLFMKNKVDCKSIQKYSDYSAHPHEDDCYVYRTSIYYWQPRDLQSLESDGNEKTGFLDQEIQWAYAHGF